MLVWQSSFSLSDCRQPGKSPAASRVQITLPTTNTFANIQENKYQKKCLPWELTKINNDVNSLYQRFNMLNTFIALEGEAGPSLGLQGGLV